MKLNQLALAATAAVALSFAGMARAETIDFDEFGPPDVTCCYGTTTVLGPIIYASLTVQDGNGSGFVMNGNDGWSSLQTSGDNLFGTLSSSILFLFNQDVSAVSFDIINGTGRGDFTVNLYDAGDSLLSTAGYGLGSWPDSSAVQHVAFGDTGVRRVEVLGTNNFAVDTLNFEVGGAVVPEPATWALMIGGFGLAGSALRRRRLATAA